MGGMQRWHSGSLLSRAVSTVLPQGQLENWAGGGGGMAWDHAAPTWAAPGSQVGLKAAEDPNFWGRGTYQHYHRLIFFPFLCCLPLSLPSRCSLEVLKPWKMLTTCSFLCRRDLVGNIITNRFHERTYRLQVGLWVEEGIPQLGKHPQETIFRGRVLEFRTSAKKEEGKKDPDLYIEVTGPRWLPQTGRTQKNKERRKL